MTTLQKLQAKMTTPPSPAAQSTYQPQPPATNSQQLGLGGKVWITKYQPTQQESK